MRWLSALPLLVGVGGAAAQSPGAVRLDVRPGSTLSIDGSSNFRNWSCKAATFEAHIDVDTTFAARDARQPLTEIVRQVSVKVAVRDFHCGNSAMENNLYKALKADDPSTQSNIVGVFSAVHGAAGQGPTFETEGSITVAGVEKSVRVHIAVERLADGTIKAQGGVPLLMTDFSVKPPTGLFGLIRSRNEIVVKFDLVIAAHAGPAIRSR